MHPRNVQESFGLSIQLSLEITPAMYCRYLTYFEEQESSNSAGKSHGRGHLWVMFRGAAEKTRSFLQHARASAGAQKGSIACAGRTLTGKYSMIVLNCTQEPIKERC